MPTYQLNYMICAYRAQLVAREVYSVTRFMTDDDVCLFDSMNNGVLLMKFLIFFLISHLRNYK